jgi:glycosyltransferase involved in cell wall biosynthesis
MNNQTKKTEITGLFVLGSLYPDVVGGMEIFNYYFLRYRLRQAAETIYYFGEKRTDAENGYFLPFRRRKPVRLFYPVQFFFKVFKLQKKPDFAYVCYAEQSWIIAFAQSLTFRIFKIPYIVTIHWGKAPDWKFKFPFISYFRHAYAVVGVSEPVCRAFKKVIPDRDFIYIPPLIPFLRSGKEKEELKRQLGYEAREKILLYVGSLKAMKNPDKIVEAFRIIGPEYLDKQEIRLLFAGMGDMQVELGKRIGRYGLDRYIRIAGLVSRENIPDYYKAADCYIISSDYEGTSLSLMEAMFNKLTIIASDAPGINEMLTHEWNALLYETANTTQLAETIKRAFSDHSLVETLSKNAYDQFKQKYLYESMMEKYQVLFSSAASGS